MITLHEVRKVYGDGPQQVAALDGVSLEVPAGQVFGVLGQSGAGKSTLIRCINLLERPTSGRVIVDGQDLTALEPAAQAKLHEDMVALLEAHNVGGPASLVVPAEYLEVVVTVQ